MESYLLLFKNRPPENSAENVRLTENFYHLAAQTPGYIESDLRRQLVNVGVEQIILQIDLLDQHFRVKNIRLVDVYIDRVVTAERRVRDVPVSR